MGHDVQGEQAVEVPRHQHRLRDGGDGVRVEAPRFLVRGHGLLVEPAVPGGVDESREQLGVVAVPPPFAQQAHQRVQGVAGVRLEARVEAMRHGQARVEVQRAAEGLLRPRLAVPGVVEVLADHPVAAAQARPGRSELRVQLQAALVQVPRLREMVVAPRELVGAEEELVRARVARLVGRGRRRLAPERQRERLHHAPGHVVLEMEEVTQRRLHGVRREEGAPRRLHELRRDPELIAGPEQGAHDDAIDVHLGGERLEVRGLAREARRDRARAHDERADAEQRGGDRVGQDEGQEVRLGIRPQDAKGKDQDARGHAGQRRRVVAQDAAHGA